MRLLVRRPLGCRESGGPQQVTVVITGDNMTSRCGLATLVSYGDRSVFGSDAQPSTDVIISQPMVSGDRLVGSIRVEITVETSGEYKEHPCNVDSLECVICGVSIVLSIISCTLFAMGSFLLRLFHTMQLVVQTSRIVWNGLYGFDFHNLPRVINELSAFWQWWRRSR